MLAQPQVVPCGRVAYVNALGIILVVSVLLTNVYTFDNSRMAYRIRNPLLRTVYNRIYTDDMERSTDHSHWYAANLQRLPELHCDKFLLLSEDEETKKFLEQCYEKGEWVFTQMYHTLAKSLLTWFMSTTSSNGLLRRGSMYVFSKSQFRHLLGIPEGLKMDKLLDLGAGDGVVTDQMSPNFREVHVTEMSTIMTWRLAEKGYKVLGIDKWVDGPHRYDVISCLNLLDRCDKPMTLLRQIRQSLNPNSGRLIVATVIPFSPYVEYNTNDHKPSEYVHISGETFEEQVRHLIAHMFEPAGYRVEKFTRLPYLCEGDLERSFYVLDDALFILKPL